MFLTYWLEQSSQNSPPPITWETQLDAHSCGSLIVMRTVSSQERQISRTKRFTTTPGTTTTATSTSAATTTTHTGGIDIQQFERKSTRTSVVVVVVLVARRWCENQATTDGQRMKKETKTRHTHFGPPSTALIPLSLSGTRTLSQAHSLTNTLFLSLSLFRLLFYILLVAEGSFLDFRSQEKRKSVSACVNVHVRVCRERETGR